MIGETDEEPTEDVWILYDTDSTVTVVPYEFQEELGARNVNGGQEVRGCDGKRSNFEGGGEVEVLTVAGVREGPEVQGFPSCVPGSG